MNCAYAAYGLVIHSALHLPELLPANVMVHADVTIRLGQVEQVRTGDSRTNHVCGTPDAVYLFVEAVGAFLVRGGSEVVVAPDAGVDDRVLRLCLLGPVFSMLLHQRGLLVLHASAVALDQRAVLFLGSSGVGKSTLAAALHARGHPIVVDDVVALDLDGDGAPMVLPAFPQLKLWPEAAAALGDTPELLPRLHPELEKRARSATRDFPRSPLRLSRIYMLSNGARHAVARLHPREGFVGLMRYSYAVGLFGPAAASPAHFQQCVALASAVPIYRLERRRSLKSLPNMARLVEEHLAGDSTA
jgi:hypothetical protein